MKSGCQGWTRWLRSLAAVLAVTALVACSGGGGGAGGAEPPVTAPATPAPNPLPEPLDNKPTVLSAPVSVAWPAGAAPADYKLSSGAGSGPADATRLDTLPRDLVALSRGGQPVYIAMARGGAAVQLGPDSTAVAMVLIRLQSGALPDDKLARVTAAVRAHPRFADLVAVVQAAALSGMSRPLDTHANPLLARFIAEIAQDVAPVLAAQAAPALPRWLAQSLFDVVPAAPAAAKSYDTTSAGGEVSVTAANQTLQVQNFRSVPWLVRKAGSEASGLATARQNGLSAGNPVRMKWPDDWAWDWGKLLREGSTVSEVSFQSAGLAGTGVEVLELQQYSVCRLGLDFLGNVGSGTLSAVGGIDSPLWVGFVQAVETSIKVYEQNPALLESTFVNLLDGVALLGETAAVGKLTGDQRFKWNRGYTTLHAKLQKMAQQLRRAPCTLKQALPWIRASTAVLAGVRDGLQARGWDQGTADRRLAFQHWQSGHDAAAHLQMLAETAARLLPTTCDDATEAASAQAAFWASFRSGLGDGLQAAATEDALPVLVQRLVARMAEAPSALQAAQALAELLLRSNGERLTQVQTILAVSDGNLAPHEMALHLIVNLMEDGDVQEVVDSVLGAGASAAVSAGAKASPWFRAVTTGWQIGTGLAVYAWDSCTAPNALRVYLRNGVVSNIEPALLRLVVTVDGTVVLRHDDSLDGIKRVFQKVNIPKGSQVSIRLTANQGRMFTANQDGLAHMKIDGGFFDSQQPALLSQAQFYAARVGGGLTSLLHRMLCTRENLSSGTLKQYAQINMPGIHADYQCQGAYTNPWAFWPNGEAAIERRAFTPAPPRVHVVWDYGDNFSGTPLKWLGQLPPAETRFDTLEGVFAASNNTVFEYSGRVADDWKSLDIVFTHFEYAETHRITIPVVTPPQAPAVELSTHWQPVPALSGPQTGMPVQVLVAASDRDGTPVSYLIDFGDGSPPVGVSSKAAVFAATHVYPAAGAYTVSATVVDDSGLSTTARSGVLQVQDLPPPAPPTVQAAQIQDDGSLVVTGTAAPGVELRITWPDGRTDTAPAAADGGYRFTRSAAGINAGSELRVVAFNSTGDSAAASRAVAPPTVIGQLQASPAAPGVLDEVRLWVREVLLFVRSVVWSLAGSATTAVTDVINGVSNWVTSFATAGNQTVTATFKDGVGGTGATVGTASMAVPVSAAPVPAAPVVTQADIGADGVARVSGTARPGVGVRITWPGNTTDTAVAAEVDGAFTFTRSALGLAAGDVVRLVAYSAAGVSAEATRALAAPAGETPAVLLREEFNGTAIDTGKWNNVGFSQWDNQPIGAVTVSGGVAQFGAYGRWNSQGKVVVGGAKFVVEARMAGGGDTSIYLIDTDESARNWLYMGNVSGTQGLYVGAYGRYAGGAPFVQASTGQFTTEWMEYRLTVDGNQLTVERGPTLRQIDHSQTRRVTLAQSTTGRQFYLHIGTGGPAYAPSSFDWLEVRATPAPRLRNPANGSTYEVITCGTWPQCRDAARARGGELATIRNAAENDWIVNNLLPAAHNEYGLWIGLTDELQESVWRWAGGEPLGYTNWRQPGEPNNNWLDGRAEAYVHMWRGNEVVAPGVWNDIINEPIPAGMAASLITQAVVEFRPQLPATEVLSDDFTGSALDASKWTADGWLSTWVTRAHGGPYVGPVSVGSGMVEFGQSGRISTRGKHTLSGNGAIVIEGRFAGPAGARDTSVMLVDTESGDDAILMGDTNYAGFGFYGIGMGRYMLLEAPTNGDPTRPVVLGSTTTAFMEYRLTLRGSSITIERGPTLDAITQRATRTLGQSIEGRSFYVSIGTAWAYYPGRWDWVRVKKLP